MNIWQWLRENMLWVLPPILGAIIGYFTNWLAIRMLFRPYRKWKLGRIPIPFTPGLLPTRRGEISAKIGLVISEQLINQEELARTLGEAHLQAELALLMSNYWSKVQKEEWTLGEVVKRSLGDQALTTLLTSGNQMIPSILHTLEHTTIKKRSIRFFSEKIEEIMQNTPDVEFLNEWGTKGAVLLQQKLSVWANEESLQSFRNRYEVSLLTWQESKTSLNDLLGDDFLLPLTHFIRENPEIPSAVLHRLLSNEELQDQLVPIIQRILDKHWSLSFLSALLSSERIRIMIHSLAEDGKKWLVDIEHQKQLGLQLTQWLEVILKKPLSELGFTPTGSFRPDQVVGWIRKGISLFTSEESMLALGKARMSLFVKLSQKSYAEWLSFWNISPRAEDIEMQITSYVQGWLDNSNNIDELKAGVNLMIETFMNCSFSPAMVAWQPSEDHWLNAAKEIQNTLARTIPPGLRLLDVSKMVERKLNEFPLSELEKLTLSVVGRELKAITWFGGLLGFMIGSLQLLLN